MLGVGLLREDEILGDLGFGNLGFGNLGFGNPDFGNPDLKGSYFKDSGFKGSGLKDRVFLDLPEVGAAWCLWVEGLDIHAGGSGLEE